MSIVCQKKGNVNPAERFCGNAGNSAGRRHFPETAGGGGLRSVFDSVEAVFVLPEQLPHPLRCGGVAGQIGICGQQCLGGGLRL